MNRQVRGWLEGYSLVLGLSARNSSNGSVNHFLAIVLHAHLPFVRHPEHESFHEENWFFEALAECYLPLLDRMQRWSDDGLPWHLTLTLTPTLCAMLRDKLLGERFELYLQRRIELAARERQRHLLQPEFAQLAGFYEDFYRGVDSLWRQLDQDPLSAFARHQSDGHLELLTCAATHAFLPLLADHPASIRAQLQVARDQHSTLFGTAPQGIWLPECGYSPNLDGPLKSAGFSHFVLETHGVLHASPMPRRSTFAPILTRSGAAAFARDPSSARQVWSRTGGYPGDPRYREFHRDLVHDADREYLRSALLDPDSGAFTGFKYHRITSHAPGIEKLPYSPLDAVLAVGQHAEHFLAARRIQGDAAQAFLDRPAMIVCPYDAELFGHWWFEGPQFLDAVMRGACADGSGLEPIKLHGYLARYPSNQEASPAPSSWGEGGHSKVWLNPKNAWIQPHVRNANHLMEVAVQAQVEARRLGKVEDPARLRALRQAGRELLLAQSSDWPFLIYAATASTYAKARFVEHISSFNRLVQMGEESPMDLPFLEQMEQRHNLFPNIQIGHWGPADPGPAPSPKLA